MRQLKNMGRLLPLFLLAFVIFSCNKKITKEPLKTLRLKFKGTGGSNGTAVAYDPNKKLYYAAIAGNSTFPLEVFDEKGNNVHHGATGFDLRGMWWNNDRKELEGNGYDDFGVTGFTLDASGHPAGGKISYTKNSMQPDAQSAGAYDYKSKRIIYYYEGGLHIIKRDGFTIEGKVMLQLPVSRDYINSTSVIYTGVHGKEAGVLDFENKKVYLFDIKSGKHTFTIDLPPDAPVYSMFRFAFANGHVWLYDADERAWTGYKVF